MANTAFYANPYDLSAQGFYFNSADEFTQLAASSTVEEFEIDYIEGSEAKLFEACRIDQSSLDAWEEVEGLDDWQKPALYYALEFIGLSLKEALEQSGSCYTFEDYPVSEGNAREYAERYIDDSGLLDSMPEQLRYYFDVAAFARDMLLGGDVTEFEYNGATYTAS